MPRHCAGWRARCEISMPTFLAVLRRLGFGLGIGALLWAAGLAWFATPLATKDKGAPTDAIIVLTGGSLRLQSGFKLLGEGKGRKLFVSGVNQEVKLNQLLRLAGNAPNWAACCVVLGYQADDTLGNALETAEWMRREKYRSLRLVTAWYHMRRSLLEFERAMPDIAIVPHPVYPDRKRLAHWWEWRRTAVLIVGEYVKYLGALFRPLIERLRLEMPRHAETPQPRAAPKESSGRRGDPETGQR
jgi:uncharacterized SAM-binding protein YcdF (DUF218 family)